MTPRALAFTLVPVPVLATAAAALAQDGPGAPPAPASADPRWAIYTSCTVVFAAIVAYLVATHNRSAAAASEVDAIERRLDELENREEK